MTTPAPLFLLRHAETTGQAPDDPLTESGFAAAKALVPVLHSFNIMRLISSEYLRARQTVEPFSVASGIQIESDHRATEWRLGQIEDGDWKSHLSSALDDQNFRNPTGESAQDVQSRAVSLINEADSDPTRTLIVSHGGWLTLVLRHFGKDMGLRELLSLRNPDLFVVDQNGARRIDLGEVSA